MFYRSVGIANSYELPIYMINITYIKTAYIYIYIGNTGNSHVTRVVY